VFFWPLLVWDCAITSYAIVGYSQMLNVNFWPLLGLDWLLCLGALLYWSRKA